MNSNEFLKQANLEHDALSEYCNSLSTLSHRINETSQENYLEANMESSNPLRVDPTLVALDMGNRRELESELIVHSRILRRLQVCHAKLIQICENMEKSSDNKLLSELFKKHIGLSHRILTTCASTNSRGYGPLHENGLLKNLTGNGDDDWHEIKVVALVSLRASIEKLKTELEQLVL